MIRIRQALMFTLAFVIISTVHGKDSTIQKVNPVQITLISPLGTNGLNAWNLTNHISLNLIAGYNGGLEGVELGGFLNILKGDMKGVQIAGFGNNNFGAATGIELAGFYNFNVKEATALELAGFSNINLSDLTGIQGSGFANVALGRMDGVQLAGFTNYTGKNSKVFQGAGFATINRKKTKGVQLAGFANINADDSKSFQGAGFCNISSGNFKGVQVSGFFNGAGNVQGSQISVFNYADTISKGVAIGFLSFVKKGYHRFELGFGETLNTTLSFKTGTRNFYNILSLGAGIKDNNILYAWGYGIGTLVPIAKKLDLNLDLISYQVNEDVWFYKHLNLLNKVNLTPTYNVSKGFHVFAGPTFNVVTSDVRGRASGTILSEARYKMYDKTFNNIRVVMYPGFTAGFRF